MLESCSNLFLLPHDHVQILENVCDWTYEKAQGFKKEAVWTALAHAKVGEALDFWYASLSLITEKNYRSGMRKLVSHGLINTNSTLQEFCLVNHEYVLDRIKALDGASESSKQSRAACYLSFTGFLNRRTQGIIPRAIPNKEGVGKTFFKVRSKVKTCSMNRQQWMLFLSELAQLNSRDFLIARMLLQGAKRISEVLSLQTSSIDYVKGEVTFAQKKNKGRERSTVITYPLQVMSDLKDYIGQREGLVFVSKKFHPLHSNQLRKSFEKAGKAAGLPFKITPHVLRASAVTYFKILGFSDSDIMKVSGHANSEMIFAYDKSDLSLNASKAVCLI